MSTPVVLTPFKIGKVELKNRIIFPSVCTFFAEDDGSIGELMFEYIRARAAGGAAALTIGGSPHGKPGPGRPAISDDKYMARWQETADMVHSYGAKLFCQLHPAKIQAGRGTEVMAIDDYDLDLIHRLVESYAAGAKRCMDHGVDGVEIHGGHAHEVAQFMSPYYNKRTDEYGGDWKRRVRFSCEIVSAIKEKCGPDFPVIFCISGSEMTEGGRDIYETALMAQEIVKAGADVIHVSCGMPMSDHYSCAPMEVPDCFNVENAHIVKEAVSVPVIAVDKIPTLEQANSVIESGAADLVAMARPLLADPELVNKYMGINKEPPCLCLACDQGCRDDKRYKAIRCTQNPMLGRESTLKFSQADEKLRDKKILIIGAGPGGLEAACDLVRRGLKPVIVDNKPQAGGLMDVATKPPFKTNLNRIADYRTAFLAQNGVEIRLGVQADEAFLRAEKPDIVLMATGSRPIIPRIPGADGENIHIADDVLRGEEVKGERVAVIGAGLVGAETAEYLAALGKKVEMFDMIETVAEDFNKAGRYFLLKYLDDHDVARHMRSKIVRIALPEITVEHDGAEEVFTGFDAAVMAVGRRENSELASVIREKFPGIELHVFGDARKAPSTAIEAIAEAALTVAAL
ncbi:MAG: FAD-dependent oxidoreductase [Oscillospiraceae bacterium]|nr:FAD-dependent oxidoreductase [Oscillospiraceae bacterium]